MSSPTVVGLDLSLARTGVCVNGVCTSVLPRKNKMTVQERVALMAYDIDQARPPTRDLFVVEAIGTRFTATAIGLARLHQSVWQEIDPYRWLEVAPAQLKKYACGTGNADKDAMVLACERAAPGVAQNNDEADAWWLYAIGRHLLDDPVVPVTQYRTAVVEALRA